MVNAPTVGPQSARPRPGLPDERFWKRYSPHGELPLSGAGSFALHVLVVGFLILWGLYLYSYFNKPSRNLPPVEAVKVAPGGGGGRLDGGEGDKGADHGAEVAADQKQQPGDPNAPPQPKLVKPENQPPADLFKQGERPISANPEAMKAMERLQAAAHSKRNDGPGAGRGQGGPGGGGDGPGLGRGGASRPPNPRMLRWTLLFNTQTGEDYVRQLRGLGAILAIPVKEGERPEYRVVRDLSQRPAQPRDEDLSKIKRIYWMDSTPRSVREVMTALGLGLQPSHFVAFMPEELEKKLFKLEKAFGGREENEIFETKFRIVERNGRFEPKVVEQTPKR